MALKVSLLVISYVLGSIPFGYVIFKLFRGGDIRTLGSGNIGATNVGRFLGKKGWVGTFLLDGGKGVLAVVLTQRLIGDPAWAAFAGVLVILGHNYSVFLKFRGGKGVATALGVFAAIAPWAVLPSIALFIVMVFAFRYVSLGSITAAGTFPLFTYLFNYPLLVVIGAIAGGALIIGSHHSNIRRLLAGTENSIGRKREES
ncbi:MAG: glycerol-3-phosphate 1-O-acyltransferase PlsY [Candidatus Aminicenantes bacterium]|nr:glycerol-3-phosphate 1-O-acyltransferase PlsY [Candidatus Aminicenantes bacterium]